MSRKRIETSTTPSETEYIAKVWFIGLGLIAEEEASIVIVETKDELGCILPVVSPKE